MEKPCFCCNIKPRVENKLNELDIALYELGMLSFTTDSRIQYLQEISTSPTYSCSQHYAPKFSAINSTVQGGFCVLHMDKKFMTGFMTNSVSNGAAELRDGTEEKNNASNGLGNYLQESIRLPQADISKLSLSLNVDSDSSLSILGTPRSKQTLKQRYMRTRLRFQKPYEVPWRNKLEERALNWNQDSEDSLEEFKEANSTTCNRSNPNSPSKSANPASGSGLLRSRSLDNLVSNVWDGGSDQVVHHHKEDIENVSLQMRNLKVN